jgi:hypothetical protein
MTREELGRLVRQVWIEYCLKTGRTDRPDRICPWEEMDDWSQEVDMCIGTTIYVAARCDLRKENARLRAALEVCEADNQRMKVAMLRSQIPMEDSE